jgi:hypothetical protein
MLAACNPVFFYGEKRIKPAVVQELCLDNRVAVSIFPIESHPYFQQACPATEFVFSQSTR